MLTAHFPGKKKGAPEGAQFDEEEKERETTPRGGASAQTRRAPAVCCFLPTRELYDLCTFLSSHFANHFTKIFCLPRFLSMFMYNLNGTFFFPAY
ncbi:MAG: hypothetical protein SPG32_06950 [Candidatus Ventricola sp.]|nr:hypothetical protein [Candidatus Ventricola sp.]